MRTSITAALTGAVFMALAGTAGADWPASKGSLPGNQAASVSASTGMGGGGAWPAAKGSLPGNRAGDIQAPTTQRAQLDAAQADLNWQAAQKKGVARLEILSEQQRIDGLIRDLESGRPVDPNAVVPAQR